MVFAFEEMTHAIGADGGFLGLTIADGSVPFWRSQWASASISVSELTSMSINFTFVKVFPAVEETVFLSPLSFLLGSNIWYQDFEPISPSFVSFTIQAGSPTPLKLWAQNLSMRLVGDGFPNARRVASSLLSKSQEGRQDLLTTCYMFSIL